MIEIKGRWNEKVIYSYDVDGATMRDAVQAAKVAYADLRNTDLSSIDLSNINLRSVDLSGCNLSNSNLSGADLRNANLHGTHLHRSDLSGAKLSEANLTCVDLSGANLSGANLRKADLRDTDLSSADLTPVRDDIWAVLSSAPREVPALIAALKAGRVDGSSYAGECSCLVGTIAIARVVDVDDLGSLKPSSGRPAERFFVGIRRGDTPETSQFSALATAWATEWLDTMTAAFATAA